ncbi:MAG: LacI family DNA-binding transcriptional regulator, partial [Clostridia bacterium]|nr:LacI family DNA-binding transcriptional regulator [Clostridia bacterium]
DNSILSESFDLTSVDQNLYEIGRAAAEILHKRILNPFKSYEHIFVPVKLIERGSVKPCADGKF